MTAVLVMLNNYFHDLSVAVFFVATVAILHVQREAGRAPEAAPALDRVARRLRTILGASFVFILVLGGVRAWFYRDFEWHEAAGRGQVPALVVKHVILVTLTGVGLVAVLRGRRGRRPSRSPRGARFRLPAP